MRRIAVHVAQLSGIALQVVQLPVGGGVAFPRVSVEADQLEALRADPEVGRSFVLVGPVVIVHRPTPVSRRASCEDRTEAPALQVRRRSAAGVVEKQAGEVGVQDDLIGRSPGGDFTGKANHRRHAQGLLEHPALVDVVVFPEEVALIRGVDHDGIARQTRTVEVVEQAADVLVDAGDAAQVGPQEMLVRRAPQLLGIKPTDVQSLGSVPLARHARSQRLYRVPAIARCRRAVGPVLEQTVRLGNVTPSNRWAKRGAYCQGSWVALKWHIRKKG